MHFLLWLIWGSINLCWQSKLIQSHFSDECALGTGNWNRILLCFMQPQSQPSNTMELNLIWRRILVFSMQLVFFTRNLWNIHMTVWKLKQWLVKIADACEINALSEMSSPHCAYLVLVFFSNPWITSLLYVWARLKPYILRLLKLLLGLSFYN